MLRRRRQSGQVIVLAAFAMTTLLGVTAVVVSAGQLYLERRQTQELADAAALAAGVMIPCSGQNAYAAVDALVSRQLDASTLLSQARSPCGSSSSSWTRTYPDGTRVTATYPYRDDSHFEVEVVSPEVPLLLGAVLKAVPTRLTARAVSQNGGVTTALNYALDA